MTVVIGLSGKKRSGKTSVLFLTKLLLDPEDEGKVRKVSMADRLREIAYYVGWDGVKDEAGRRLLQLLGTEVIRECIDKEYWVKAARKRIYDVIDKNPSTKVVIVPDVRFENEADMVKSFNTPRLTGYMWRIRRPAMEDQQAKDQHPSELGLDDYTDWDHVIVSEAPCGDESHSFAELFTQVKEGLKKMGLLEGANL